MLKLIKCEFLKLKRKKFIPLIILAAFLFPIPLTYLMTTPSMMERYTDRADAFDGLFNMVLGYGIQFLLPCIIGVIASILFFMERDNDTFNNRSKCPVFLKFDTIIRILIRHIPAHFHSHQSTFQAPALPASGSHPFLQRLLNIL